MTTTTSPARLSTADLPPAVLGRLHREPGAVLPPADPAWHRPDPRAVRDEIRDERRRTQAAAWDRSVPAKYRAARLDQLGPGQDPDGRIRRWLGSSSRNLILTGAPGTGKTHAAYALGYAVAAAGRWPLLVTAPDLNALLKPDTVDRELERIARADVVIFDDLGRERVTEWTLEQFWRAVNTRHDRGGRCVWTTNLPYDASGFRDDDHDAVKNPAPDNLLDRYGASVVDRIVDNFTAVRLTGASRRAAAPLY